MSTVLFYGPSAREHALEKGRSLGRIIEEFGHPKPMKVDDARAFTKLVGKPPVSNEVPVIVVGLDEASPRTQDVLLKVLEEHDSDYVRLVLWITDLGVASPTVKSRCLTQWAHDGEETTVPLADEAQKIVQHLMSEEYGEATALIRSLKGEEKTLLSAMAFVLKDSVEGRQVLWPKVRVLYEKPLTNISLISAVIGD